MINQQWPDWPETDDQIGGQVEALLRHFTPDTRLIGDAQYEANLISRYDRVVVIGNDPTNPLPSVLLGDLARTDRPILWLGYGVGWLPKEPGYGFHVEPLAREDAPRWVEYGGERYSAALEGYVPLQVRPEGDAARGAGGLRRRIVAGAVRSARRQPVLRERAPDHKLGVP